MSQPPYQSDSHLTSDVRVRLPLPLVIPLGALLVIAAMTVGFSQILLAVPKEVATVLALAMATNVLLACTFLASERGRRASLAELLMVTLYPVVIGIVIAQVGVGAEEEHSSAGEQPPAASAVGPETVTAQNVSFNVTELTIAADEATTLTFENNDTSAHNISIYDSKAQASGGEALFEGEIIDGGSSVGYEIEALEPGQYYFQCDLHPAMNGSVFVE